jgi:hypothetical protein
MLVSYPIYMTNTKRSTNNVEKSDVREKIERNLQKIDEPDPEELQSRCENVRQRYGNKKSVDIRFITYHSPIDIYVEYNKEGEVEGLYEDVDLSVDEDEADPLVSEVRDLEIQGWTSSIQSDMTSESSFDRVYVKEENIRQLRMGYEGFTPTLIRLIPADVTEELLSQIVTEYTLVGLTDSS